MIDLTKEVLRSRPSPFRLLLLRVTWRSVTVLALSAFLTFCSYALGLAWNNLDKHETVAATGRFDTDPAPLTRAGLPFTSASGGQNPLALRESTGINYFNTGGNTMIGAAAPTRKPGVGYLRPAGTFVRCTRQEPCLMSDFASLANTDNGSRLTITAGEQTLHIDSCSHWACLATPVDILPGTSRTFVMREGTWEARP